MVISLFYQSVNYIDKVFCNLFSYVCYYFKNTSMKGYLLRKGVIFHFDIQFLGEVELLFHKDAVVQIGKAFICRGYGRGIDMGNFSQIVVAKGAKLLIGDYIGIGNTSLHYY